MSYDYKQTCSETVTVTCPESGARCFDNEDCLELTPSGDCSCPSPLPNSHLVSGDPPTYTITQSCEACLSTGRCRSTGTFVISKVCYYKCDDGYFWDGSSCVLAKKELVLRTFVDLKWKKPKFLVPKRKKRFKTV